MCITFRGDGDRITDEVKDRDDYALDGANRARGIVASAMFGAFRYNDQDDDEDERNTDLLRRWVVQAAIDKAGL